MDAQVLLVVDDGEPTVALLERMFRSGAVTAFHARAVVSRDLELRRAAVPLDLQVRGCAP